MRILGIETSCDETCASVIEDGRVLSSVVQSQLAHSLFGGVVPEVASRVHMKAIVPVVRKALLDANADIDGIEAVAVTSGPGLIGSLIVGVSFAKAFCFANSKELIAVDHVEAHIAAILLEFGEIEERFVCLVVSGGHTHLFLVENYSMRLLGSTRDDSAGEAFDKVARMLGLKYPGGPEIENLASLGNPEAIEFPQPVKLRGYEFSFSGLKTAVRYYIEGIQRDITQGMYADIAASFQKSVLEVLVQKTIKAACDNKVRLVGLVGGVACNKVLRKRLEDEAQRSGLRAIIPSPWLCSDNGAMVAMSGYLKIKRGEKGSLDVVPYSTTCYSTEVA
ncbi:MAG: tRNA (adenosine(37)-N6)-threonylcarbamoyltransferase complex transferase subunit TsaD [bacterium]